MTSMYIYGSTSMSVSWKPDIIQITVTKVTRGGGVHLTLLSWERKKNAYHTLLYSCHECCL